MLIKIGFIVLIIVVILLLFYIVKIKKELKYISNQIKDSKGSYVNIHTKAIDNDIENLVCDINFLYDEGQKIQAKNKNIEEELRRSIANISHDLRTPLTSIMGYIQLINEEDTMEDERKSYIEIIERRCSSLQKLISSFYDLSRLHSSEFKFELKKINIKNILCDNIAQYYNEFVNKEIEPIIDIEENISSIVSDDKAVNRIFSNLIGNMLKHGDGKVKISLREEDKYIVTTFCNSAKGLTTENVEKIFNRFYTADKSRSDMNTGLGLAITKSLVEGLGNSIDASLENGILNIKIKWNKV
ncbi:HAMP domain-containing histidine kinase [Clostridium sp. NSJ-49]|uniref:sensor histidine kinase n=1 Tax=Clostridium TaxID=1485 RepID=UPI00164B3CAD|nr:HAMP domain-containing sensor histidine kinase [Clostridium sp. NSJ-49]MBC5625269.1 HAMP domain-containing histidine kinase [Clostridium sp. NSJ-49]